MVTRALMALAIVLAGLVATVDARPPTGPPPPPTGRAGPGSVRCGKCNGTGWHWDDNRWKLCNECNGVGWLNASGRRGDWDPRWGRGRRNDFGGCFIATAAYGTMWAANVTTLRTFRDECLLQSPVGRGFVSLYYSVSPPVADAIRSRPWAQAATRVALTPAVVVAGALTGNPADIAISLAFVGLGALAVPGIRRAVRRRRAAEV